MVTVVESIALSINQPDKKKPRGGQTVTVTVLLVKDRAMGDRAERGSRGDHRSSLADGWPCYRNVQTKEEAYDYGGAFRVGGRLDELPS